MPDTPQNNYIQDLLNLLTNRVYRRRQQSRVPDPDGYRIIEDVVDDTGIGSNDETDINVIGIEHILDCGHPAKSNLGGRCHLCDALVCRACITLCSSCGHSICPTDTVSANFDGQLKPYCRLCAEEIARYLRLRKVGRAILSFFISGESNA